MNYPQEIKSSERNFLLAAVLLSSFFNPFMGAAVNIALPVIGEQFSMDATGLSWVSMSFLLASATLLIPFGKIGDIWGRKRMFLYANVVFAISSLLSALSVSGSMLIAFRFLQGAGGAMMISTGLALITSAFPPQQRGRAIGLNISAVY